MSDPDPPEPGSFYQLLYSNPILTLNDNKSIANAATCTTPDYSDSFYGPNPPKMLCFGGYKKEEEAICSEITAATFKQMVSQSDSSSASSANNNTSANPNRKRHGVGQTPVNAVSESKSGRSEKLAANAIRKPRPKPVRKEKIGERIATLQQLVSPFGKTDTASVLHEASCYIKFLHDQVQVLSSPYLQTPINQEGDGLRNRGLCLVPMAYTAEIASANGADFWAPAGMD